MNLKRIEAILKEKIDMIVVDTAHAHTKKVSQIIKFIKKRKVKKVSILLLQSLKFKLQKNKVLT